MGPMIPVPGPQGNKGMINNPVFKGTHEADVEAHGSTAA